MSARRSDWASALDGYELSDAQLAQLATLLDVLERDEHAPTTVRDRASATNVHLADSLVALDVDSLRGSRNVVDLGAGAGFPGLALAVALAHARVDLVESQRRKCDFIERMSAAAGIGNARVVCARAEEWAEGRARNDAVLARALAAQPVVLEYAAPLLRIGGTLVDWRGRRDEDEERSAALAAAELGLELREVRHVEPFAGALDRHLHVWQKTAETPDRFPRRAGIARKRPLGASAMPASDRDRR
jgi:16S rRNA (guanine527-N7)-methyltransferase